MSTLSQFGSGVKSIQRGTITLSTTTSVTTTISAVNVNKAVLNFLGCRSDQNATQYLGYISLTNSTTVTAIRGTNIGGTSIISYEVIEYN